MNRSRRGVIKAEGKDSQHLEILADSMRKEQCTSSELVEVNSVGITGEPDGTTDTRRVLIPIGEYDALLAVAEAAKGIMRASTADDILAGYRYLHSQRELVEAVQRLEAM